MKAPRVPSRYRLTGRDRQQLDDALAPLDVTGAFVVDVEFLIMLYVHDVEREQRFRSSAPDRRANLSARIARASALLDVLVNDDHHLRQLLHEHIALWEQLQSVGLGPRRPVDGAVWWLGVRVVEACERAGMPLTVGRVAKGGESKHPVVNVLRWIRVRANRAAGRVETSLGSTQAYEYARDSVTRYREIQAEKQGVRTDGPIQG